MPDWIAPSLFTLIIALQSWILLEIIRLKVNSAEYRSQLGRIVSDIESEKGTRKRVHEGFDIRIRALEVHRR